MATEESNEEYQVVPMSQLLLRQMRLIAKSRPKVAAARVTLLIARRFFSSASLYEPEVRRIIIPKTGEVFLDVGSRDGFYSRIALLRGATVLAFDPSDTAKDLKMTGYQFFRKAVGDFVGNVPFIESYGMSAVSPNGTSTSTRQMITIDSLNLKRVDWIKIDTQGHEVEVLRGATETLDRFHPTVVAETHGDNESKIVEELAVHDYRIKVIGWGLFAMYPRAWVIATKAAPRPTLKP